MFVEEELEIEYYYAINLLLISKCEIREEIAEYILSRVYSYRITGGIMPIKILNMWISMYIPMYVHRK